MPQVPNAQSEIRPVLMHDGPIVKALSYSAEQGTVSMDAVHLSEISLADFKRIHTFFRKLEALKTGVSDVQS